MVMQAYGDFLLLKRIDTTATSRDSGLLINPITEYVVTSIGSKVNTDLLNATVIVADEKVMLSHISKDSDTFATVEDNIVVVI
tara:strand:+ start:39 stop:287 length:249 start_codon:yes stop_codon:yes gene_type:complete